jgi:undecaprenyl-diphosphatase
MGSTICYLLLAFLIASRPGVGRKAAIGVYVVAIAIIVAVALSRLYLDLHYLSDVLGGAAAGLAWLAACGATRQIVVGQRHAIRASATERPVSG